jgi:AbrB family looped-hinge helix DNA binding protein
MRQLPIKVGRRGTIVLPAELRKRFEIREDSMLVATATLEGILLHPASIFIQPETYSPERRAEFLLMNAVGHREETAARRKVRQMGLDPDAILASSKG